VTVTTSPDILDVVAITIGPRPHDLSGRYWPWTSGVTLLLDDDHRPFGAVIVRGLLQSRKITLPLRAIRPPHTQRDEAPDPLQQ
jgi:hypothetical protein